MNARKTRLTKWILIIGMVYWSAMFLAGIFLVTFAHATPLAWLAVIIGFGGAVAGIDALKAPGTHSSASGRGDNLSETDTTFNLPARSILRLLVQASLPVAYVIVIVALSFDDQFRTWPVQVRAVVVVLFAVSIVWEAPKCRNAWREYRRRTAAHIYHESLPS